jgi:hypothetical protein
MPPEGQSKMIVPELDDNGVATLAVLQAVRQLGENVKTMGSRMEAQTDKLNDVHTAVQVMAEQNKAIGEMKLDIEKMEGRIKSLEDRNTLQDGAVRGMGFLKEYAPWLVAVLAFLWGMFGHAPAKL